MHYVTARTQSSYMVIYAAAPWRVAPDETSGAPRGGGREREGRATRGIIRTRSPKRQPRDSPAIGNWGTLVIPFENNWPHLSFLFLILIRFWGLTSDFDVSRPIRRVFTRNE